MLWLYLLGIVTVLAIVVRRLLLKQKPLDDELYSYRLAIDHVSSGVAWVDGNGQLHSVNPALAEMLATTQQELAQKHWLKMFPAEERPGLEDKFSQMLLAGRASLEASTCDSHGQETLRSVLIVAVHDHKMRFVGHHCIIERIFEEQPGFRVSTAGFATLSN